ncbi:hypothetical protein N7478_010826 [Penicillium angulare]|uniref:uncharacterized protein n=1 Tax=Penicillium angulare TaxID=116970 RepID=UPI002540F943|nr:uncharacterized protein N7478_010826 [Penicillium angulare]KAJ5263221.1 hypothetical protein N7478_010826 [Penicillium angulare]
MATVSQNVVIMAFNDTLDIEKAYAWNLQQIFRFIEHVASYSYLYDVPPEESLSLESMRIELEELWYVLSSFDQLLNT